MADQLGLQVGGSAAATAARSAAQQVALRTSLGKFKRGDRVRAPPRDLPGPVGRLPTLSSPA
jgi:hypothetical protein